MTSARVRERRDGFLLLDKPAEWTSHRALQEVKRRVGATKAGHTGSLDPLATGLLPLCFGTATRFSRFLLDADKTYEAQVRLGVETDTYDSQGRVMAECADRPTREAVLAVLARFQGVIWQIPPMFSAIKQGGEPLYRRARLGEIVPREPRPVTIHRLALTGFSGEELGLLVTCSKGTYIRSLAFDLGRMLGCGAHIVGLRRTGVGRFTLAEAVSLAQIDAAVAEGRTGQLLQSADRLLAHLPALRFRALEADRIRLGQTVPVGDAGAPEPGWVRLYEGQDRFLGVGWLEPDGGVRPRRIFDVREA
ncbi:MAG: tRNA pseudouridine(55) synthase TruB [Acidiferrobacteraceae bacterium]